MFLNRIHLDPRSREARRDLSDPYQLHSTLCRAFSGPDTKCSDGEFMWRLEPEIDPAGYSRVLVQSRTIPDWEGIGVEGWLAAYNPPIDLKVRLKLDSLRTGQHFRFRLRANPCVTRNGKRLGLLRLQEQEEWIARKGLCHGFSLPRFAPFDLSDSLQERVDVRVSQEQMLRGNRHSISIIHVFSVLYDGILAVTEPERFSDVLKTGIGHGKVMGLGLLSVVPIA
jgi:CRISPR system Cascade subunit CasE